MASYQISPPEKFNFQQPDTWPKWIRRFERFSQASGLTDKGQESQVNALIYCMGEEADDIMSSFGLTEEDSKSFETVKTKFESHFIKKRNVVYERAKFNLRKQEEGELVDTFITALYKLAEHCEYGNLREELIRDRIVIGVWDKKLSLKLQMEDGLTLEKAISSARQNEAVKKQQAVVRCEDATGTGESVDRVGARKAVSGRKQTNDAPPRSTQEKAKATCLRCGKGPPHPIYHCPAKYAVCHKCHKKGHYQECCLTKRVVGEVFSDSDSEDEAFLGTIGDSEGSDTSPWWISLKLNSVPVKLKIDTGADVSVIPRTLFKKQKMSHCNLPPRAYRAQVVRNFQ